MRRLLSLLSFVALCAPAAARAQMEAATGPTAPHPGFAVSLGVGYAIPAGNSTGAPGDALSSSFSGQVPLMIEFGGNVTASLFLGLYGTYAFGSVGPGVTACGTGGLSCSAHSAHGGFTIEYRFLPGRRVEPWIGYGFGIEWQGISMSNASGASSSTGINGLEYGHFKFGLDVLASPMFALGPFVDVSVGQFSHVSTETNTPMVPVPSSTDADVTNTALHEWLTFGLRGVFMP